MIALDADDEDTVDAERYKCVRASKGTSFKYLSITSAAHIASSFITLMWIVMRRMCLSLDNHHTWPP